QAIGLAALEEVEAHTADRIEAGLGRLVGDQFYRGDQPNAAHLAHQRMIGEAAQAVLEARSYRSGVLDQLPLFDDLQVLKSDRGRHRMRAGGVAVAKGAELLRVVGERLVDLVG